MGHVMLRSSHAFTHWEWYSWVQAREVTLSPSAYSAKQMMQAGLPGGAAATSVLPPPPSAEAIATKHCDVRSRVGKEAMRRASGNSGEGASCNRAMATLQHHDRELHSLSPTTDWCHRPPFPYTHHAHTIPPATLKMTTKLEQ
jgi:hypothetical protein